MDRVIIPEESPAVIAHKRPEQTILFVCSGNTCRSPMAAALFNARFADKNQFARSAGLAADGSPMAKEAIAALSEAGIPSTPDNPYLSHLSHSVTEEDLRTAASVIGLTDTHAFRLMMAFPAYASKITSFPEDIPDPYGGDTETYRMCLHAIEAGLAKMFPIAGKPFRPDFIDGDPGDKYD